MLLRNDDCNDDGNSDNDDRLSNETPISTIAIIRRRGKMSAISRSTKVLAVTVTKYPARRIHVYAKVMK